MDCPVLFRPTNVNDFRPTGCFMSKSHQLQSYPWNAGNFRSGTQIQHFKISNVKYEATSDTSDYVNHSQFCSLRTVHEVFVWSNQYLKISSNLHAQIKTLSHTFYHLSSPFTTFTTYNSYYTTFAGNKSIRNEIFIFPRNFIHIKTSEFFPNCI